MSRNEAMENYVEELKKIVETMSYTDNVENFLVSLDSFYENVPAEDLELLVGPVLERIRSQPGSPLSSSPLGSRETSPHRVKNGSNNTSRRITSSLETSPATSHSASPLPPDTDGEDEEFKDTIEIAPEQYPNESSKSSISVAQTSCPPSTLQPEKQLNGRHSKKSMNFGEATPLTNGHHGLTNGESGQESLPELKHNERGRTREKREENRMNDEFINHISTTVQNLQKDLDRITGRVRCLEGQTLKALAPVPEHSKKQIAPRWWPLPECSPRIFALMIVWPFVVQILTSYVRRNRQRTL
ncbi:uncharacterized protein [Venturia canescens]|nr:uncharacterized protein LOC122414253 isoform X2 [Venturia canescens]XP_043281285.1 uncharacterized protein LOC122414253 isoform X2 [Venturia canescens]